MPFILIVYMLSSCVFVHLTYLLQLSVVQNSLDLVFHINVRYIFINLYFLLSEATQILICHSILWYTIEQLVGCNNVHCQIDNSRSRFYTVTLPSNLEIEDNAKQF